MIAIIFGANGQDGFYLQQLLQLNHCKVIPITRRECCLHVDISSYSAVADIIKLNKPDFVFHLAANSTTNHSALFENHSTICLGTLNILEAVKNHSPGTKVFISGSGLQFKNEERPITEGDDFEARDAYSVSRISSVYAARYFRSLGIKTYVGYFFNHESPRRTERHMTKKISEAAKRISKGSTESLEIGDVSVIKEYTYAGDIVKAIWVFVMQERIYEANLGSGLGYSISDWLQMCFGMIDKDWRNYVTLGTNFRSEYKQLVCDPSLIFSLGWRPEVSLEQLAKIMMD